MPSHTETRDLPLRLSKALAIFIASASFVWGGALAGELLYYKIMLKIFYLQFLVYRGGRSDDACPYFLNLGANKIFAYTAEDYNV